MNTDKMELISDDNYHNLSDENYISAANSDDDFDESDVVVRHPRRSAQYLLADGGDGSEADLLGTTPPRSRIRNKEIRKNSIDSELVQRTVRMRRPGDTAPKGEAAAPANERFKKRASLKLYRSRERDWKQDLGQREHRADSLPPAAPAAPAVPTLVESCNRFMCLTSRLKSRDSSLPEQSQGPGPGPARAEPSPRAGAPPASRVSFHNTFSMLINMGNVEKGCRRTISREEQVWQNELKDLIWLELQARLAGRGLAHQDAHLCAQRNVVPTILNNIMDYRFVNPNPCRSRPKRLAAIDGSREDLTADDDSKPTEAAAHDDDEPLVLIKSYLKFLEEQLGCLSLACRQCAEATQRAAKEVGTLLDSFHNAVALYPSSQAMTAEHPLVATQLFKNRLKAMCLWYNTATHMRLKMLSVYRMVRSLRRPRRRQISESLSVETSKPCQVRFNVSEPSDSNNSDSSNSEYSKEKDAESTCGDPSKDRESHCQESHSRDRESESNNQESTESRSTEATDKRPNGREDDVTNHSTGVKLVNGDEVDNARVGEYFDGGGLTPSVVISDCGRGTADTSASSESGYASEPDTPISDAALLADLTRLRLLGKCTVSPYRAYHYEMLKTQGVRRCMMFMNKMRQHVLHRVHLTLEKPDSVQPEPYPEEEAAHVFDDAKQEDKAESKAGEDTYELRRYGCWSEECRSMRLPSYRGQFLALSCVCMEAVHDYLALRLEQRPAAPSCLTVKQLIHELKEGLDIATEMRQEFVRNVRVAVQGAPADDAARADLLLLLRSYDHTVETLLKQYLSYLRTMSETEHMPRAWLRQEWAFTATLAHRAPPAAALAPPAFADISCNQITRLLNEFQSKFDSLIQTYEAESPLNTVSAYALCRAVQGAYSGGREPLLHAAQWARVLANKLRRGRPPAFRARRARILEKLMSMREFTVSHTELVLERTRVPDEELELTEGLLTRVRELLLQMFKLGFELHRELYKLVAPARGEERPRGGRPASLQPPRPPAAAPPRRRPGTMILHDTVHPTIHKELHSAVQEAPRRNQPPQHPQPPQPPPPAARPKYARAESVTDDNVFDDRLFDSLYADTQNASSIERLLSGEEGAEGVEGAEGAEGEEPVQLRRPPHEAVGAELAEEEEWAFRVGRAVIQFAKCWMRFVVDRCDRGRGLRPRWASQGLEFLMLACDPCNTRHLTEEEFEELKQLMDGCISHVIGSRPAPAPAPAAAAAADAALAARPRPRLQSPSPNSSPTTSVSGAAAAPPPPPPTPPTEPDPPLSFHVHDNTSRTMRVRKAVEALEEQRDNLLRRQRRVGRVAGPAPAAYEPKLKQVTFKWQRGLKIGAGSFGKVYTVVNTESGQLLAMKELSIIAGDRRALQRAANELRVLEGVIHPHLVRYYGCELHREEMLIFMELCVEGSLEALIATSGALEEHTTRRYGKQLVSAVLELHARNIAHRDIKSGNIFLTNEGHCLKLGDFGCAVKIRANTTAPGELQGFVGTQAYMAPEVFMKSSGHGRAADVWSLGCVVTEMACGQRPFSEYDSNYQIMFVVGMGGRPDIPETLSPEGRDFCLQCLTHDPDERPRADQLSMHHFLMVKSDDDCRCEPGYLVQ